MMEYTKVPTIIGYIPKRRDLGIITYESQRSYNNNVTPGREIF